MIRTTKTVARNQQINPCKSVTPNLFTAFVEDCNLIVAKEIDQSQERKLTAFV